MSAFFQKTPRNPFVGISVAVIIALIITVMQLRPQPTVLQPPVAPAAIISDEEYTQTKELLLTTLEQQTPREALTQLAELSEKRIVVLRSCHPLVHELGRAAYAKYKDLGKTLSFQEEFCSSGFIHGVLEAYFVDSEDIFVAIKTACSPYADNSFIAWDCYHGIGHGVMFYTANDLPKSLQLCTTLPTPHGKATCVSGVYMENFMTDQKLHPSSFLRSTDPFYPCKQSYSTHTEYCYAFAPIYLLQINKNHYKEALVLCDTVGNENRSYCLYGVGNYSAKENILQPAFTQSVCAMLHGVDRNACIAGMINRYITHYGSPDVAKSVCPRLNSTNKLVCERTIQQAEAQFTF